MLKNPVILCHVPLQWTEERIMLSALQLSYRWPFGTLVCQKGQLLEGNGHRLFDAVKRIPWKL